MRHPELNRRKLLKVAIGGSAAAYVAVPTRFSHGPRPRTWPSPATSSSGTGSSPPARRPKTPSSRTGSSATLNQPVVPGPPVRRRRDEAADGGDRRRRPSFANVHFNWRVDLQRAGILVPYPADLFNYDELISTKYNRDASGNIYTSTFSYYSIRSTTTPRCSKRQASHRTRSRAPGTSTSRCASSSPRRTAIASPRRAGLSTTTTPASGSGPR